MSKLILGLDVGITSIGWALILIDKENNLNNKIIDSGVRIFTIAEHPKDGKSLALPRREARSARRTTKRKAQKVRAIKRLLQKYKIITLQELEHLFIGNKNQKDVWQLRRNALYQKLDNKELARVMIHIAKHRGYFSNRKSDQPRKDDKEGKAVLGGISHNEKILDEKSYLTIGEYLSTKDKKRNSKGNYENSISRAMLEYEIETIFAKQKEYGNTLVNDTLLQEYKTIAFTQRPLKSVEGMVANCPFETSQKRAPKASISFETFRALQKLKNLRIITQDEEITLSKEQILQVVEKAKTVSSLSYKQLKKFLGFDEIVQFKGLSYFDHKTGETKEPENTKLLEFSAFVKLKKVLENADHLYWSKIENDNEQLDKIAEILSTEKDDNKSLEKLRQIISNETVCQALLTLSFSGFGHVSIKALQKINPHLANGLDYDKACEMAGYDFKAVFQGDKTLLLPPLTPQENLEMTNPVVKRAIAQMRLVYNALARKYGALDAVHVEVTRDIKKSHKDRNEISKAQEEFQTQKEEAKVHAIEVLGKEPNAKELLKFRLWKEQNKECIYSGKYIDPHTLCDPYATEVDHVLPYSRSLDDSLNNKVLCLTKENQNKGNKTPFEYFGSDKDAKEWQEFVGRIEGLKNLKQAKKSRLTKTNFDQSSEQTFKERNKNDTSYIAKFVKNYIEAHIAFKESKDKQHVFTRNGMLTTQLRYKWGVGDKNRQTHLHHAEDAIIVAFSTQSQVQKLSETSSKREGFIYEKKEEKAKKIKFEPPMEDFGAKVQESIETIFVSFMPRRKVGGSAHKETVYSPKTMSVKKEDGKIDTLKGNSSKNNVKLKHGIALNDGMPRIDLFQHKKTKKYYIVPIYVSDFVKETLPNKAIVAGNKPWLEMDEEYEFMFSFYKNDLIGIKTKQTPKKESVQILGYYDSTHSGTAQITIKAHDASQEYQYGAQNLVFIKKYQVDPLGNYVEVKQEKRQGTKKQK
ncbi:type II CRISPR RNA-guided endonuclease Cas9 [Sulfurimonas sp.]|uniref:type II CRISPR RNA-guided endonuclease Cas9 n=1 Tax=Sulfurimonas sp. TaxID=2022749 RepID=UPI003D105E06